MAGRGWLLLIPLALGLLATVVYFDIDTRETGLPKDLSQLPEQIRKITDTFETGTQVLWDLEPTPPTTETVKIEVEKTREVTSEDGTVTEETYTEIEEIPSSEIYLYQQDRQTGQSKICVRGHQCDIIGQVSLISPITLEEVTPPHTVHFQISCEFQEFCNLLGGEISRTLISDGEGNFKYTWTTTYKDVIQDYHAFVRVTSQFEDVDGNRILDESMLVVKLIE